MQLNTLWSTELVRANLTARKGIVDSNYGLNEASLFVKKESPSFIEPVVAWQYSIPPARYLMNRRIPSPVVLENTELNHLVFSLFQNGVLNLKGLVYEHLFENSDFSWILERVDMQPFMNLGSSELNMDITPIVENIQVKDIKKKYEELVSNIMKNAILGKNTASKFWSLRKIKTAANMEDNLRNLVWHLSTRLDSVPEDDRVRALLQKSIELLKLSELSYSNNENTLGIHTDDIFSSLWHRHTFTIGDRVFSIGFSPRDSLYLSLWNRYGDCTSIQKECQADDVKNIFWTKASWILDPFYQILEIQENGEPLLKFHLMLSQASGQICLIVDAIESSISMREFLKNSGSNSWVNTDRNTAFSHRFELLDYGFQVILDMAKKMKIDTVLVEEYSNTTWVRESVAKMPRGYLNLSGVSSLYDGEAVDSLYQQLTGQQLQHKRTEIQIVNTQLQDKWLHIRVNSVGILGGKIDEIRNPYRGI